MLIVGPEPKLCSVASLNHFSLSEQQVKWASRGNSPMTRSRRPNLMAGIWYVSRIRIWRQLTNVIF